MYGQLPFSGTAEIINPSNEEVYVFMKKLFQEVYKVFPDPYVHLGMDEVYYDCWSVHASATNGFLCTRNPSYTSINYQNFA